MAFSIQILALISYTFLQTSAVRDEHTVSHVQGCSCFDEGTCSSCDMSSCPFTAGISWVQGKDTGGTDKLHGYAAWTIVTGDGKHYIVKFKGSNPQVLEAAKLAHALNVMTPKQLFIDYASCPSLWDQNTNDIEMSDDQRMPFTWSLTETRECQDGPCKSRPTVAVQEHAGYLQASPQLSSIERSFWYQAGAISAFDWITGKSDLFNDLSLGWKDDATEYDLATRINRENIIFTSKKLVAIDLGINMVNVKWPLWDQLLDEIGPALQQPTWVRDVLFPMLALIGNPSDYSTVHDFPKFNLEDLSGWDKQLSLELTMLGLTRTIQEALEMYAADATNPRLRTFLQSLDGMKKAHKKGQKLTRSLSQSVFKLEQSVQQEIRGRQEENKICCKVQCTFQDTVFRKNCKLKSEHVVMKLGSQSGIIGGFVKTVQEGSCEDIQDFRLSHTSQESQKYTNKLAEKLRGIYCDCTKGSKHHIDLSSAQWIYCNSQESWRYMDEAGIA
mmetsp:Transcript_73937/g.146573  ORF Transcript_73937/g.146573 Transcript_73937/m.146573 type:complete len:500 (+) Transcript_73937:95-1594(+)